MWSLVSPVNHKKIPPLFVCTTEVRESQISVRSGLRAPPGSHPSSGSVRPLGCSSLQFGQGVKEFRGSVLHVFLGLRFDLCPGEDRSPMLINWRTPDAAISSITPSRTSLAGSFFSSMSRSIPTAPARSRSRSSNSMRTLRRERRGSSIDRNCGEDASRLGLVPGSPLVEASPL